MVNIMKLTDADRKILRVLQRDATISMKDLAAAVAMSPTTVWRRVQDLEDAGLIIGRVTLVDPLKLGLAVTILLNVNIVGQNRDSRQAFENFVAGHPNIQQCFTVTGAHDYVLVVRMQRVEDFERFLMEELLAHPSVASTQSQLILRQSKSTTELPV